MIIPVQWSMSVWMDALYEIKTDGNIMTNDDAFGVVLNACAAEELDHAEG